MLLADVALARRIDGFEARGSRSIGEAAARIHPHARAFVRPLGQGIAVYAGPGSPANKIIAVGFGDAFDSAALEAVEQEYFERLSPVQAEVATLASPAILGLFTARGYLLQGFEDVLGIPLADREPEPGEFPGLTIEIARQGDLKSWIDILIEGFLHADETGAGSAIELPPRQALEDAFNQSMAMPGFRAYIARLNGAGAGGGGLRVGEGIAQFCGAATLPALRRRGIQTALLRRRLRDARGAGCDLGIMTAQPGSRSHFNAQRHGFSLLYSRAILVKLPPAGAGGGRAR